MGHLKHLAICLAIALVAAFAARSMGASTLGWVLPVVMLACCVAPALFALRGQPSSSCHHGGKPAGTTEEAGRAKKDKDGCCR